MKKFLVGLLLILLYNSCLSQADSLQRQINNQVWKPFMKSYNDRDDEGFKNLHSKDVVRVSVDDNVIFGYDQYFREVPESVKKRRGLWKRNLELRFIQRIADNSRAYEVGYFQLVETNTTTNEIRTSYGKFRVVLRKEHGIWKILVDADANEKTDETIFISASKVD